MFDYPSVTTINSDLKIYNIIVNCFTDIDWYPIPNKILKSYVRSYQECLAGIRYLYLLRNHFVIFCQSFCHFVIILSSFCQFKTFGTITLMYYIQQCSLISDDSLKYILLNDSFCSFFNPSSSSLPNSVSSHSNACPHEFLCAPNQIVYLINCLPSVSACGSDGIPSKFLKSTSHTIAIPLPSYVTPHFNMVFFHLPGSTLKSSPSPRPHHPPHPQTSIVWSPPPNRL